MGANRLNFDGYIDYSFSTFEDIVSDIRSFVVDIPKIIKKLSKLRGEVVKKSSRLDDPKSILNYIDYCTSLFEGFEIDFKRLLVEIPNNIENRHIEILHNLVVRSKHEELECCIGFKREHIARTLKDESLRFIIGEIYEVTRDLMSVVGNLGDMPTRLKTFIESIPQNKIIVRPVPDIVSKEKKQKNILNNIVPFPAPAGSGWNDVRIRFLSNKAVDIRAGTKHEGRQYTELGFIDERSGYGKSSILWLVLASFGKCEGEISRSLPGLDFRITKNLKAHVYRLGNILTQIFGIIHESPFKHIKFPLPNRYVANFHIELTDEEIYDDIVKDFVR